MHAAKSRSEAAPKWVYLFGTGSTEGGADPVALLGGKGANLAEMASLSLPVPPGFTITTEVCALYYANDRRLPDALRGQVVDALEAVGNAAGATFGDASNPLPAIREGLPLHKSDWKAYLDWAVECFRLASSGVADKTQIHTHMCYSEFNDIIDAIGAMDADVISMETARSKMELLEAFSSYHYPNEIGPGVYDIHAPRCPSVEEIIGHLATATHRLSPERIWVNPDCGLKTRKWKEVRPALVNMVKAAVALRSSRG